MVRIKLSCVIKHDENVFMSYEIYASCELILKTRKQSLFYMNK